jgi:hypothetical protein
LNDQQASAIVLLLLGKAATLRLPGTLLLRATSDSARAGEITR